MPYVIDSDQPVSDEIRRIVRKQLKLAILELSAEQAPSDGIVHDARRHIKKARVALRLCRDALRPSYRSSNRRLRRATRLLAPIADGEAVVRAFMALASQHAADLQPPVVDAVRRHLEEQQVATDRHAARHHLLRRVIGRLEAERTEAQHYSLHGDDYALLAPGFERTIRRSRSAMARAMARGTAARYHAWRRRVKDHWLQTRLLNGRCDGRLTPDTRQLDQLDALLGDCHDFALLAGRIQAGVPLPRPDAAACLRVVRREQWARRHAAVALGRAVYDERAAATVGRAARAWRAAQATVTPQGTGRSCPRVA